MASPAHPRIHGIAARALCACGIFFAWCALGVWAQASAAPATAAAPSGTVLESARSVRAFLEPSADQLFPGQPFTVALALPRAPDAAPVPEGTLATYRAVLASEDGRRLAAAQFFHIGDLSGAASGELSVLAAVLAVPNTAKAGTAGLSAESSGAPQPATAGQPATVGQLAATAPQPLVSPKRIAIIERDFLREEIALDQANTDLRTLPDPKKTAQSEELWRLLSTVRPFIRDGGAHALPVQTQRRTSSFGDRRVYLYKNGARDTSIHGGIDFGVPKGTPVAASSGGQVVLAQFRIVTGFTVAIEHLPGVYTLYYHLDSLSTAEGRVVGKGETIGWSGSTGISTGPHLHWELRVAGEAADPDMLLSAPILDKNAIISRIARTAEAADGRSADTYRTQEGR